MPNGWQSWCELSSIFLLLQLCKLDTTKVSLYCNGSEQPSGVQMVDEPTDGLEDALRVSGLKWPKPDLSDFLMDKYLSLQQLQFLEENVLLEKINRGEYH